MNVEEVMDALTFAETLKAPSLASVDLVIVLILTREAAQILTNVKIIHAMKGWCAQIQKDLTNAQDNLHQKHFP